VSLSQITGSVKVIAVEGEVASAGAAAEGSYPLARELWLVTLEPPGREVERFLGFCLSPVGQGIVGRRHGRIN
jgi:ABC-type phosphate transport system substrate-binding protein